MAKIRSIIHLKKIVFKAQPPTTIVKTWHPIAQKYISQLHRSSLCRCLSLYLDLPAERVARPVFRRYPMLRAGPFTQSVCLSPYAVFFIGGQNRRAKVWAGLQTTWHYLKWHQFILFAQKSGNLLTTWQQPNKTRRVTQAGQASSVSQRPWLMAGRRIIPALAVRCRRMCVLPLHIYD